MLFFIYYHSHFLAMTHRISIANPLQIKFVDASADSEQEIILEDSPSTSTANPISREEKTTDAISTSPTTSPTLSSSEKTTSDSESPQLAANPIRIPSPRVEDVSNATPSTDIPRSANNDSDVSAFVSNNNNNSSSNNTVVASAIDATADIAAIPKASDALQNNSPSSDVATAQEQNPNPNVRVSEERDSTHQTVANDDATIVSTTPMPNAEERKRQIDDSQSSVPHSEPNLVPVVPSDSKPIHEAEMRVEEVKSVPKPDSDSIIPTTLQTPQATQPSSTLCAASIQGDSNVTETQPEATASDAIVREIDAVHEAQVETPNIASHEATISTAVKISSGGAVESKSKVQQPTTSPVLPTLPQQPIVPISAANKNTCVTLNSALVKVRYYGTAVVTRAFHVKLEINDEDVLSDLEFYGFYHQEADNRKADAIGMMSCFCFVFFLYFGPLFFKTICFLSLFSSSLSLLTTRAESDEGVPVSASRLHACSPGRCHHPDAERV
jgi:hypothetical protein